MLSKNEKDLKKETKKITKFYSEIERYYGNNQPKNKARMNKIKQNEFKWAQYPNKPSNSIKNQNKPLRKSIQNSIKNVILVRNFQKGKKQSQRVQNLKNTESKNNNINLSFENRILTHKSEKLKARVPKKYWEKINEAPLQAKLVFN